MRMTLAHLVTLGGVKLIDYDPGVPTPVRSINDLTQPQLARILTLSKASRRAVKLYLHGMGLPARSEDVDAVLVLIDRRADREEIGRLAGAFAESDRAAQPAATGFDPVDDLRRELIRRNESAEAFAARVAAQLGIPADTIEATLRGETDPPASVLLAILAAAGAKTVHFSAGRVG